MRRWLDGARGVGEAYLTLLAYHAALLVFDFWPVYRFVAGRRWPPTVADRAALALSLSKTVRAVQKAYRWRAFRAFCLPEAMTLYTLLRSKGVPALLIIGARKRPFAAHAWVEVFDRPVKDRPLLATEHYRPLLVCGADWRKEPIG